MICISLIPILLKYELIPVNEDIFSFSNVENSVYGLHTFNGKLVTLQYIYIKNVAFFQ